MNRFSEKDWKLFRNKIADWQEAYMEKLNREYIELLSSEAMPQTSSGNWRSGFVRIRRTVVFNVR